MNDMSDTERATAYRLLESAVGVPFRVVSEEVLPAPGDEAEFGMRLKLQLDDPDDPDSDVDDLVETSAFGFLFALAVLSFADARPRGYSEVEYRESDDFSVGHFLEGLSFRRGALHFMADYLHGRRIKTSLTLRPDGSVTIETVGRGKAPLRWLDHLKGEGGFHLVGR